MSEATYFPDSTVDYNSCSLYSCPTIGNPPLECVGEKLIPFNPGWSSVCGTTTVNPATLSGHNEQSQETNLAGQFIQ
jgi:hypothetical protein